VVAVVGQEFAHQLLAQEFSMQGVVVVVLFKGL
jgi:hypothetical protein